MRFVLASLPAALIGVWNIGGQVAGSRPETVDTWQLTLLERFGAYDAVPGVLAAAAIGSLFFVPLLVASLAVSRLWAELFSRSRGRPLDPGWFLWAWLYTLLLPATMPIHFAVLGLSFGVVFGAHVFGGTGRYIVNPALLGIVFTAIAYPALVTETAWLPGVDRLSSWASVTADGVEAGVSAGRDWMQFFAGREIGALGTGSAAACLLGAAVLGFGRHISWAVVAAAFAGLAAAGALAGTLPWHWHLVLGNFAFVLAFVATDPTTQPSTRAGRVAFGALFGVMTIVLRTANPDHPEGAWFALLLASLCVPLLDRIAVSSRARLRGAVPDDA